MLVTHSRCIFSRVSKFLASTKSLSSHWPSNSSLICSGTAMSAVINPVQFSLHCPAVLYEQTRNVSYLLPPYALDGVIVNTISTSGSLPLSSCSGMIIDLRNATFRSIYLLIRQGVFLISTSCFIASIAMQIYPALGYMMKPSTIWSFSHGNALRLA